MMDRMRLHRFVLHGRNLPRRHEVVNASILRRETAMNAGMAGAWPDPPPLTSRRIPPIQLVSVLRICDG